MLLGGGGGGVKGNQLTGALMAVKKLRNWSGFVIYSF